MTSQKVYVIFSTDMYKEDSVKSMERNRRGSSEKLLLQVENKKKPADWKNFLTNEDNKKQLAQTCLRHGTMMHMQRSCREEKLF